MNPPSLYMNPPVETKVREEPVCTYVILAFSRVQSVYMQFAEITSMLLWCKCPAL